jgi:hypothetical protein
MLPRCVSYREYAHIKKTDQVSKIQGIFVNTVAFLPASANPLVNGYLSSHERAKD